MAKKYGSLRIGFSEMTGRSYVLLGANNNVPIPDECMAIVVRAYNKFHRKKRAETKKQITEHGQ